MIFLSVKGTWGVEVDYWFFRQPEKFFVQASFVKDACNSTITTNTGKQKKKTPCGVSVCLGCFWLPEISYKKRYCHCEHCQRQCVRNLLAMENEPIHKTAMQKPFQTAWNALFQTHKAFFHCIIIWVTVTLQTYLTNEYSLNTFFRLPETDF